MSRVWRVPDFLLIELCRLDEVQVERDTARVAEEPNTEHQADQKRGEEPANASDAKVTESSSETQLEGQKHGRSDRRSDADRSSYGDRKSKKRSRAGSENASSQSGSRSNSRANSRSAKRSHGSRSGRNDSNSPLTTGLFSALRDKEVPCRVDGCDQTWTWYASQQIKGFGQPPPPRMCDDCLGNFNTLEDREVPCRNSWCNRTWSWKRGAQLHARQNHRGKLRTPARLCSECFESERALRDIEVPCKVSGCKNTWIWAKDAQIRHRAWVHRAQAKLAAEREAAEVEQKERRQNPELTVGQATEGVVTPTDQSVQERGDLSSEGASSENNIAQNDSMVEDSGAVEALPNSKSEKEIQGTESESSESQKSEQLTSNQELGGEGQVTGANLEESDPSSVPQINSKNHESPELDSAASTSEESVEFTKENANQATRVKGSKRKRSAGQRNASKKKKIPEGPPEKMCGACTEALNRMHLIEASCKVHGCTGTWTWDRASQLRQWIASGADLDKIPGAPPKRMCDKCREFCRINQDRQVECGRPGCTKTWTYKTGAQLQASLAGQHHDPSKMCEECLRGQLFLRDANAKNLPPGAETMPCVVSGCTGTWIYIVGMQLIDAANGEIPVDRMCDNCRVSRNLEARTLREDGDFNEDSSQEESSAGRSFEDMDDAELRATEQGSEQHKDLPAREVDGSAKSEGATVSEVGELSNSVQNENLSEPSVVNPTE